jgi:hypothetical protein
VTVFRRSDGSYAFSGILRGKLHLVDFNPEELELDKCLIAKTNIGWLWHRRLGHVGMRNLHKLQKEGHILELMNAALRKIGPVEHVKRTSGSTTSCKKYHDNNKTFENAIHGLVRFYHLH